MIPHHRRCLFGLLSVPGLLGYLAATLSSPVWADSFEVQIVAGADNTLYDFTAADAAAYDPADDATWLQSNGSGNFVAAGLTSGGKTSPAEFQRGLLRFDLAAVPGGATVTGVSLGMHLLSVPKKATRANDFWLVALQPGDLQADWGEGGSSASYPGSQVGRGRPAEDGDATWFHTQYDDAANGTLPAFPAVPGPFNWTRKGALGEAAVVLDPAGAVGSVDDERYLDESLNQYTFSSSGMLADVQGWVDGATSNLGWVLVGEETETSSRRAFASREHAEPLWRPTLTVTYTLGSATVPEPAGDTLLLLGLGLLGAAAGRRRSPASEVATR